MAIKHKIKVRNQESKSVFKDGKVSNDYKSGGAYKAMLNMFAEQVDDKKFAEHCKNLFNGDDENNP